MLIDARNLPVGLRIKMPEFLEFVKNFRQIVVARCFVSVKNIEMREARAATKMLSTFLYNVLIDNKSIMERHQELLE